MNRVELGKIGIVMGRRWQKQALRRLTWRSKWVRKALLRIPLSNKRYQAAGRWGNCPNGLPTPDARDGADDSRIVHRSQKKLLPPRDDGTATPALPAELPITTWLRWRSGCAQFSSSVYKDRKIPVSWLLVPHPVRKRSPADLAELLLCGVVNNYRTFIMDIETIYNIGKKTNAIPGKKNPVFPLPGHDE